MNNRQQTSRQSFNPNSRPELPCSLYEILLHSPDVTLSRPTSTAESRIPMPTLENESNRETYIQDCIKEVLTILDDAIADKEFGNFPSAEQTHNSSLLIQPREHVPPSEGNERPN